MNDFEFLIPKKLYAVLYYDKKHPQYKGILYKDGTSLYIQGIPFESLKEAEEAAERISSRQNTKIISWTLKQKELEGVYNE